MKKLLLITTIILATLPVLARANVFDWLSGSSQNLGDGNIGTLDQWTSTTSPQSAITQRVVGKPLKITGLTSGQNVCISSNGLATTSGCTSGSGTVTGIGQTNNLAIWASSTGLTYNPYIYKNGNSLLSENGIGIFSNGRLTLDAQGDGFTWIEDDDSGSWGTGAGNMVFGSKNSTFEFVSGEEGTAGLTNVNLPNGSLNISTTPVGGVKLHSAGMTLIETNAGAEGNAFRVYSTEYARNAIRYDDDNAFVLLNEGGGYVGVNTDNPQTNFHVNGGARSSSLGININPTAGIANSYDGTAGKTWTDTITSGGDMTLTPGNTARAWQIDFSDITKFIQIDTRGYEVGSGAGYNINYDTRLARNAAGRFVIDTGTAGQYRDLLARNISLSSTTPSAKLTVHAVSGETNANIFTVASSTLNGAATTTVFNIASSNNTTLNTNTQNFDIQNSSGRTIRIGSGNITPLTTNVSSLGGTSNLFSNLYVTNASTTNLTVATQATMASTTMTAPLRLKGYTVATLPQCVQGDTAFVTDALAPTFLATVAGGGAIVSPVFCNATNSWVSY